MEIQVIEKDFVENIFRDGATYRDLFLMPCTNIFAGTKWYIGSIDPVNLKAENTETFNLTTQSAYLNTISSNDLAKVYLVLSSGNNDNVYRWTVNISDIQYLSAY